MNPAVSLGDRSKYPSGLYPGELGMHEAAHEKLRAIPLVSHPYDEKTKPDTAKKTSIESARIFSKPMIRVGGGAGVNPKKNASELKPVTIADLYPAQPVIEAAGVNAYIDTPRKDPVDVIQVGDRLILVEGHTRTAAAKLRGEDTIEARVFPMEKTANGWQPVKRARRRDLGDRSKYPGGLYPNEMASIAASEEGALQRGKDRFHVKQRADGRWEVRDHLKSHNQEAQLDVPRLVKGNEREALQKAAQMNQRFGGAKEWNEIKHLVKTQPGGVPAPVPPSPDRDTYSEGDSTPPPPGPRQRGPVEWQSGAPDVDHIRPLGGGINPTYVARMRVGDQDVEVVYKPEKGQKKHIAAGINDYKEVDITGREAAAHDIDRALGLGIVPETRIANGPHGKGSAQQFITDAKVAGRAGGELWGKVAHDEWYKMGVLDLVIDNHDRHAGNFMISPEGKLHAIDHGYAFSMMEKNKHIGSDARPPRDDLVTEGMRRELATKLRTTNFHDATGGKLKGRTLKALETRAQIVANHVENGTLNEYFVRVR